MIYPDFITYRKEIYDIELEKYRIDLDERIRAEFSYKLAEFILNKYPVNKIKHKKYVSTVFYTDLVVFEKDKFNQFLIEFKQKVLNGEV